MKTIIIYLNVQFTPDGHLSGMINGYQNGDEVTPVFAYAGKQDYTPAMLAEDAFRLFNAPPEYLTGDDAKTMYRYRGNKLRSLSVGDVVSVDGELFAVASLGFTRLDADTKLNVVSDPFSNW